MALPWDLNLYSLVNNTVSDWVSYKEMVLFGSRIWSQVLGVTSGAGLLIGKGLAQEPCGPIKLSIGEANVK